MKILWFSTCRLSNDDMVGSGTWLQTMAAILVGSGAELVNVTCADTATIQEEKLKPNFTQYLIPEYPLHNGLPAEKEIREIVGTVDRFNPDIIQIWGLESWWGLLSARGYLHHTTILEIQGIIGKCAEVYYGGLSSLVLKNCATLRNIRYIRRFSPFIKKRYEKWAAYEKEILAGSKIVSVQSEWVRKSITPYLSKDAEVIETGICVRSPFFEEPGWKPRPEDNVTLFTITSTLIPYKGIHDALEAFAIIRKTYPGAIFEIAGSIDLDNMNVSTPEYSVYLKRLIGKLGLEGHVRFVGSLTAEQLAAHMRKASLMIHPSYVESYSLALAESMAIGVPSVVSKAGAMTELAEDEVSALYFRTGDAEECAEKALRILSDPILATGISANARKTAAARNGIERVKEIQFENYNKYLK